MSTLIINIIHEDCVLRLFKLKDIQVFLLKLKWGEWEEKYSPVTCAFSKQRWLLKTSVTLVNSSSTLPHDFPGCQDNLSLVGFA